MRQTIKTKKFNPNIFSASDKKILIIKKFLFPVVILIFVLNCAEACENNSECLESQFCNTTDNACQNLSCPSGYYIKKHACAKVLIVGCKIGAKIGAKMFWHINMSVNPILSYHDVIEISGCSNLNKSNAIYFLAGDISSFEGVCLNITAENISLDCRWNSIKGNGSSGILVSAGNALIENCIVEGWENGIYFDSGRSTAYCNLVENNTYGVISNYGNKLYKNLIRNNTYGASGNFSNVTSNEIIENIYGVSGDFNVTLEDNVICRNEIDFNSTNFTYNNNCSSDFDSAVTTLNIPLESKGSFNVSGTAENLFNLTEINITLTANDEILDTQYTDQKKYNFNKNLNLAEGLYFITLSSQTNKTEANELNNKLSNALIVAEENKSLIYGYVTEKDNTIIFNASVELINCSSSQTIKTTYTDINGMYFFVVEQGNYTLNVGKKYYSSVDMPCGYIASNTIAYQNQHLYKLKLTVKTYDNNDVQIPETDVYLQNCITNETHQIKTDINGSASFTGFMASNYKIIAFKYGYSYAETECYNYSTSAIIAQQILYIAPCAYSNFIPNFTLINLTSEENPPEKDEIKKGKILKAIYYFKYKRNSTIVVGAKIGAKIGAKLGAKGICPLHVVNASSLNLFLADNESFDPKNQSLSGVYGLRLKLNSTLLGDVDINFSYANPDFSNVTANAGIYKNHSYSILHLDNNSRKTGNKTLYIKASKNSGKVCVNESALTLEDIDVMINTSCYGGKWIHPETITYGGEIYYKIIINGSGGIEGELNTCTCDNCTDCEEKLNNASCDIVNFESDIINHSGTCINNPEGFSNKIFDCQGHTIDGNDMFDGGPDDGIRLYGKNNNTIKNCIITGFDDGIFLGSSSNNTLTNNSLNSNDYGIALGLSSNNTLINNTANSNKYWGISLSSSSNNTLNNNTANNNAQIGIHLDYSSNNTIQENEISNNRIGIYSQNSNSTINSNFVCGNINLDFNSSDWQGSSGNNNACNNPNGWNDTGAVGCSIKCSAITPGDSNGDGAINIFDVIWAEKIAVGLQGPPLGNADADCNGVVNIFDVIWIEKIAVGLPGSTAC